MHFTFTARCTFWHLIVIYCTIFLLSCFMVQFSAIDSIDNVALEKFRFYFCRWAKKNSRFTKLTLYGHRGAHPLLRSLSVLSHTHSHTHCMFTNYVFWWPDSKKIKTETNKQKCPHTSRQICDGNFFNSNSQNSLQCSKVKQDVRMLRATASSFLDGGCCCWWWCVDDDDDDDDVDAKNGAHSYNCNANVAHARRCVSVQVCVCMCGCVWFPT